MQPAYLRFFLPLALTGVVHVAGTQFRNGVLARYPDPARQLSTYAYALSAFVLFWSVNNFVPQASNVFARSERGWRVTRNVVGTVNLMSAAALLALSLTAPGRSLIAWFFGIEDPVLAQVQRYVCLMAPLLPISGHLQLLEGLLVQRGRSDLVFRAQAISVATLIGGLLWAFLLGAAAMTAILLSHYAAALSRLGASLLYRRRHYRLPAPQAYQDLHYREVLRFLWPTTVTSLMFTVSRPILYACLSRTGDPLAAVAGMRIAYDVLAALQAIGNQFRHFFVTLGTDDMAGKRRFMMQVALLLTGLLGLVLIPGPRAWVFTSVLGVRDAVFDQAVGATTIMLAGPAVLMTRNYFHGQLLAQAIPRGMAVGATLRAIVLATMCLVQLALGLLDARGAALSLLLGFAGEVLVSRWALRRAGGSQRQDGAVSRLGRNAQPSP